MGLDDNLGRLPADHREALLWFHGNAGQVVQWPEPLGDVFLVNRAKGIHKPRQLTYALSIRGSNNSPYEDHVERRADGSWRWGYPQEGADPEYFTNKALRACMRDDVPVGVIKQIDGTWPSGGYEVFGLGQVFAFKKQVFEIHSISPPWNVKEPAGTVGTMATHTDLADKVDLPSTAFDPRSVEDARERELRAIALRRGQAPFRRALLTAYGGRCAVSGCSVQSALEAAHIVPYLGPGTHHVTNGLLLRADIHTLFDLYLLWVDPKTRVVRLDPSLKDTEYEQYEGMQVRLPLSEVQHPQPAAFEYRASARRNLGR
jgi:putative restriction endonuclease